MTNLQLSDFNSVSTDMNLDVDANLDVAVNLDVNTETPLSYLNSTRLLLELAMTTAAQTTSLFDDNISMLTTTETPYVPYGRRAETYIVPILFAIIFVVGVLGNGTLIVVFLSVRQMRNVPNT